MKQVFLLILTITLSAVYAQSYIMPPSPFVEFQDSNFMAICLDIADTNGDGKVSFGEAAMVESATFGEETDTIFSTVGISYFWSLDTFRSRAVIYHDTVDLSQLVFLKYLTINNESFQAVDTNHLNNVVLPKARLSNVNTTLSYIGIRSCFNTLNIINSDSSYYGVIEEIGFASAYVCFDTSYITSQYTTKLREMATLSQCIPTTSITKIDNQMEINIYPNPTQTTLNIGGEFDYLIISSVDGRRIMESEEPVLDVSALNNGMYIITIISDNKMITKKFMKN